MVGRGSGLLRVWNREKPMIEIGSVRVRAGKKSNGREWDSEVGRGTMRPWVKGEGQ
jgi:hypothetical protein